MSIKHTLTTIFVLLRGLTANHIMTVIPMIMFGLTANHIMATILMILHRLTADHIKIPTTLHELTNVLDTIHIYLRERKRSFKFVVPMILFH